MSESGTGETAAAEARLFEDLCELETEARAARLRELDTLDPTVAARLRRLLAIDAEYAAHTARRVADDERADPTRRIGEGDDIGAFRLVRRIGRGGMGVVYLGERRNDFAQQVAVKIMPRFAIDARNRERFAQERRILAQLHHPNICGIIDGGELDDGTPYLVMEYVPGESLCAWSARNALPLRERIVLFLQLCDAVRYAHGNLVIHRDLKDSNALIDEHGAVKLLDFGIAKSLDATAGQTAAHDQFFSPMTAAPEQVRGERATVGVDVYALGALLQQLLCGALPFESPRRTPTELQRAILDEVPPKMSDVLRDSGAKGPIPAQALRGELDAIVAHCLRKAPEERYASVGDLARDLRAWLSGLPISISRGDRLYRFDKFLRRHRLAVAFTTTVAIGVIGALAVTLHQAGELRKQRDAAESARQRSELDRDRARAVADFMRLTFEAADPSRSPESGLPARELIARGARRLESLSGQQDLQADLALLLAESYAAMGLIRESDAIARDYAKAIDALGTIDTSVRWRARSLRFSNDVVLARDGPEMDAELATLLRLADSAEKQVQAARMQERLLARRSQFEAAAQTLEHTWRRHGGALSPSEALRLRVDLGNALLSADRDADARRLCDSIDREALRTHEPALQIRALRLIVRESRGRGDDREPLAKAIEDWVRTAESLYGPDSIETASAYVSKVGVIENALEQDRLMDRAYTIQRAKLPPVSAARAYAEYNMAAFYHGLRNRPDLAEPHLALAVEIGRQVSSRAHADVLKFELAWAEILNALGRHRICLERMADPPDIPEDAAYAVSLSMLRLELAKAATMVNKPMLARAQVSAIRDLWRRIGKTPPDRVSERLRKFETTGS